MLGHKREPHEMRQGGPKGLSSAGATVFVTGHKLEPVEELAAEILGGEGTAFAATVVAVEILPRE